mmetsp:Transcript_25590/g.55975  ORF Transcript_25590/g.55975 Transcript_25590/m.55975 type:complete len:542 (-) Transcript_25590:123-1748(-)
MGTIANRKIIIEVGSVAVFLTLAPMLLAPKGRHARPATRSAAFGPAAANVEKQRQHPQPPGQGRDGADLGGDTNNRDTNGSNRNIDAPRPNVAASAESPHRSVLLLGLVRNLGEVEGLLPSIEQLCTLYANQTSQLLPAGSSALGDIDTTKTRGAGIWITYANVDDGPSSAKMEIIRKLLKHSGCTDVVLEEEPALPPTTNDSVVRISRYERLARLRSNQRQRVMQRYDNQDGATALVASSGAFSSAAMSLHAYNVVANIDFDLLSLPDVDEFVAAVEAVASSEQQDNDINSHHDSLSLSSLIVCANGYETWLNPKYGPRLYYDTLPAIDAKGRWYYQAYSRDWFQVVTFGQRRLHNAIRSYSSIGDGTSKINYHRLWPMKSCFGGVAMYGWEAFSSLRCDYVRNRISLPAAAAAAPSQGLSEDLDDDDEMTSTWQFPEQYTLTGMPHGDACEHAVFQLCLEEEYRQRRKKDRGGKSPSADGLVVGIHQGLIVSREASILSTEEAVSGSIKVASLLALVLLGSVKFARHNWKRSKNGFHEA